MTGKKTLYSDRVMIQSGLPIMRLLDMEIVHHLNEHGRLSMRVMIQDDEQEAFLNASHLEEQVQVFDKDKDSLVLLFCGKIQEITCEEQDQVLMADIDAISYSVDLTLEKKCRSFQNPTLTFERVVEQVMKGSEARFLWQVERNKKIERPYIQYEETDWDFLIRLASYFNSPLQVSFTADRPDFYVGIRAGEYQDVGEPGAEVLETGFRGYYDHGGFEAGHWMEEYRYIQLKHRSVWEIGDYVRFRNQRYTVFERRIQFEKGELFFVDMLGTKGMFYQKPIYNDALVGLKLQGTIRKVEKESVYIQLDIDDEERADYAWAWVPEVGNLCYTMPEVGSRVVLSLSTDDEQDGLATHLLRTNSESDVYRDKDYRVFSTAHDKMLGLYPDQILLEGADGVASVSISDVQGIYISSKKDIQLQAQEKIMVSAEDVFMQAPKKLLMQTNQSNIELSKNINLYAPKGVRTEGRAGDEPETKQQYTAGKNEPMHHLLTHTAEGAIQKTDLSRLGHDQFYKMTALGALPQMMSGAAVLAMRDMKKGKKPEGSTSLQAFSGVGSYTSKGGFYVPRDRK